MASGVDQYRVNASSFSALIICDEAACAWQFPTGCFLTLVRVPARESIIVTSSTTRLKASLCSHSKSLSSLISSSDSFSSWVGLAGELAALGEAGCTQALRPASLVGLAGELDASGEAGCTQALRPGKVSGAAFTP